MKFVIKLIYIGYLLICSFHLFSVDIDEVITGNFHGYEIESVIPDFKIEISYSHSNYGNEFDHTNDYISNNKIIHNNLDTIFYYEFLKNIGVSSNFSFNYNNRNFKLKSLDLDLFGEHFKFGFSFDFLTKNKNWSNELTETDGFTQVYFQYYNNFQIFKKIVSKYSIGYRQIFHDELKKVNDLDIVKISKFNNRSVLYISNKFFASYRNVDFGFEFFFNYYRGIRVNSNYILRTNGYIFSISPYLKLKFPTDSIFIEVSSVSKYENFEFGYPVIGYNAIAPIASIQINLIKEWDN